MQEVYMTCVGEEGGVSLFTLRVDGRDVLQRRPMTEILERLSCEAAVETLCGKEELPCLN